MKNTIQQSQKLDLVPFKKNLSIIENRAFALIIKTEEQTEDASDILFQISQIQERIKEEKNKFVEPAKTIILQAKKNFDPIINQCVAAEGIIKGKIIKYDKIKQKKTKKKLASISKKVASGKMSLDKASEKIEDLKLANKYEGKEGAIQFRINKKIQIIDEKKIPREYMMPNLIKIRADALRGVKIAGIEVVEEKIVATRR